MRRTLSALALALAAACGPQQPISHCYDLRGDLTFGIRTVEDVTPLELAHSDPNIVAVMNGPFFDEDGRTVQGLQFLSRNHRFGRPLPKGTPQAYFVIPESGEGMYVTNTSPVLMNTFAVVSNRPALVVDNQIHADALLGRWSGDAKRSAIATRTGNEVCFLATNHKITMSQWANELQAAGFSYALNMDGGSSVQIATRDSLGLTDTGMARESPMQLIVYRQPN